jgi:ABC-type multidrug transport system fused ATPase/permease subunit
LAIARALVRRAKVIVMYEATISVDYETDANIQVTIKEEFKGATLLVSPVTTHEKELTLDHCPSITFHHQL